MSWDYRIIRYRNDHGFGLHEVYYDDDGEINMMTENATGALGDTPGGVVATLEMMLADAKSDLASGDVVEEADDE